MLLIVLSWVTGLTGFLLVLAGVAQLNVPAAFIVAGLGLLGWSLLADRAAAAMKPKGG